VEKSIPATYFIIPFKGRAGEHVAARSAPRRAVAYEVGDLSGRIASLRKEGCEVAVHGIDAWHSVQKGREERSKLETVSGAPVVGIRMHWLLRDSNTAAVLEAAGYTYDAGLGYNETIGYRNGTTQAFRPLGSCQLLELPLHIQDGALFFPRTLDLSEAEARHRCSMLIDNARRFGGVLTVLWHDRSHGPERFWGDFYADLVGTLRSTDGWFGTAAQVVAWFDHRRAIRFERVDEEGGGRTRVCYRGPEIRPPVKLRVHRPNRCGDRVQPEATTPAWVDLPWNGQTAVELGDSTEDRPDLQTRHFESIGTLQ
jgi:hypothetical protein